MFALLVSQSSKDGQQRWAAFLRSWWSLIEVLGDELTVSHQCVPTAKAASSLPGCVRQSISSRSREVMLL